MDKESQRTALPLAFIRNSINNKPLNYDAITHTYNQQGTCVYFNE